MTHIHQNNPYFIAAKIQTMWTEKSRQILRKKFKYDILVRYSSFAFRYCSSYNTIIHTHIQNTHAGTYSHVKTNPHGKKFKDVMSMIQKINR